MWKPAASDVVTTWIVTKNYDALGHYLLSGSVHGKPGVPAAELARVEKLIKATLPDKAQYQLAKVLLKRDEYAARCIAAHLLASGWPNAKDINAQLRRAAHDPDWIVREFAAGGFAAVLAKDFSHFAKVFLEWVRQPTTSEEDVNVKRAVALAVRYDAEVADPEKWKSYLGLVTPLLSEEAEYIRKNLGPFAIGDRLLSRFPEEVLKCCAKWSMSPNSHVRWNTAMIFTAAASRRYAKEGKIILKNMAGDEDKSVERAVQKALKNLK